MLLWDNEANTGPQISLYDAPGTVLLVAHSDAQGGETAVHVSEDATLIWGPGNIEEDPLFLSGSVGVWTADSAFDSQTYRVTLTDDNAEWRENALSGRLINPNVTEPYRFLITANTATTISVGPTFRTIADGDFGVTGGMGYEITDYRFSAASPCIDAGDNTAVPPDVADINGNGDTTERSPLDVDGKPRFIDDGCIDDTGVTDPPTYAEVVDMGAYEYCRGDLNDDGNVDLYDYMLLHSCINGPAGGPLAPHCERADFACDQAVYHDIDLRDFAAFQTAFR